MTSEEIMEFCNGEIAEIKKEIRRFRNYRKWYKFNWLFFSKSYIDEYIYKYKSLLRIWVSVKRSLLSQQKSAEIIDLAEYREKVKNKS